MCVIAQFRKLTQALPLCVAQVLGWELGAWRFMGQASAPRPSRSDVRIQSWRTLQEVEVTGVGAAVAAFDGRQE